MTFLKPTECPISITETELEKGKDNEQCFGLAVIPGWNVMQTKILWLS